MFAICGIVVPLALDWGLFSFYLVVVLEINFGIVNSYKGIALSKVFTGVLKEEEQFLNVTLTNHNLVKNLDSL
jgi:hypothetical protein